MFTYMMSVRAREQHTCNYIHIYIPQSMRAHEQHTFNFIHIYIPHNTIYTREAKLIVLYVYAQ